MNLCLLVIVFKHVPVNPIITVANLNNKLFLKLFYVVVEYDANLNLHKHTVSQTYSIIHDIMHIIM